MPGRVDFEVNLGAAAESGLRRSDTFRILVMGDFSGRRNRALETLDDLAVRPVLSVDVDVFDAVFRTLSPALALGADDHGLPGIELEFGALEDFHPDHLYNSLEPFRKLRESRMRLLDPKTFEQEASRLMEGRTLAAGVAQGDSTSAQPPPEEQAELLQRLIGAPADAGPRQVSSQGLVDGLIRKLVQPHIEPGSMRAREPYIAALDASSADVMRALLHDPDFQALEAAWRGLRRLVDSLEIGSELELQIADVSKGELLADLEASRGNPSDSAAHRLLVESGHCGPDEQPWSLLIGDYRFGAEADDITLLAHLGVLASRAGGPFVAGADPSLIGCDVLDERTEPRNWAFKDPDIAGRWDALRHGAVARWLGLAMPRVLLRLPYGAKTDCVDAFSFEEYAATVGHEAYLWGNPALACAQIIGQRFLLDGPDASVEGPHEIDDLPAHVRDRDGERQLQACAEFVLPVRVAEEMLRRGVMPLLSYGNRNAARLLRVQSIAEPCSALARLD